MVHNFQLPSRQNAAKKSGPQDAKVSAIISELGRFFLRAFIIPV